MLYTDFLANKTVAQADLFGPWHQRGVHMDESNAFQKITTKLTWLRNMFTRAKLNLPANAEIKFKRDECGNLGRVEWGLILVDGTPTKCYTISPAGFNETPVNGTESVNKSSKKPAKEMRSPKEIQDAIPLELRHSWTNYDLMDELNERVYQESCQYWDSKSK